MVRRHFLSLAAFLFCRILYEKERKRFFLSIKSLALAGHLLLSPPPVSPQRFADFCYFFPPYIPSLFSSLPRLIY